MKNSNLEVLRPKQVCKILGGIHISTLYRWIDDGTFPIEKIQLGPRAVGFRKSDVIDYIDGKYEPQKVSA
jgi:excisionase family DNA binding protein